MTWVRKHVEPLDRLMQQNYLGKWTVGVLIGVVAGLGAAAFYFGIQMVTNLMLGGITGFFPPSPAGEIQSATSLHPDFPLVPVSTVIGGLIAGIVIFSLAHEAQGHGTDEARRHRRDLLCHSPQGLRPSRRYGPGLLQVARDEVGMGAPPRPRTILCVAS